MGVFQSIMSSRSYVVVPSEPTATGHFRPPKFTRRRCMASLFILAGVLTLVALTLLAPRDLPVRAAVDELYARQSTSLEQAAARYTLKNSRSPPPNYDRWYQFAKSSGCLIDDYDQVHRDFEPFYQLAKDDPAFFKRMVDRGTQIANTEDMGITTIKVDSGEVRMTSEWGGSLGGWLGLMQNMSSILPDMNIVLNYREEPRVVFNPGMPDARAGVLTSSDATPFKHAPRPTSKYYKDAKHCIVPNEPKGFMTYGNDASSFLLYSASADFTTDLYPVMSQSKISPCFADILFPSELHYDRSPRSSKYSFPDNVSWKYKKPLLYWRGESTGGWISGTNYRSFPRFKVLDIARAHPEIMNVAASGFHERFCQLDGCDAAAIKAEYNITSQESPREEGYKYKYVLDLDGNAFSGRYLGLLKSGSLVFKSTLFTEYFSDWLRPFEHYVPVLPDLSDLVERIEWAKANDAEARRIQAAGMEFAQRVLTDKQNDCYFAAVLLEWARLQAGAGGAPG
ncbi:glycosyl transferase family 90-domain-containing protein [Mycena rosella]|uniref:Glycosyl transferase family 90-domain-containing protein n=1 Tax=Mycena rosella TaxID=1033263 RepID=A0AAD7D8R7_MYCRO|nr:glycosyl transferase family 90-domain-containing protein [Mycena rosella]